MKKLFAACDFSFKTLDFPAEWKENGLRTPRGDGIFCWMHLHAGTELVELMKKMLLGLSGVLVFALLLPGCPTSGREYLFTEPMVVRIDLKKDGVCNCPLYVRLEQKYENANNNEYIQEVYMPCNTDGYEFTYNGTFPDFILLEKGDCGITISHASSAGMIQDIANNYQIDNWNPDIIDLSIHVQNLCTNEEFHFDGNVDTYDISIFPDCEKMMAGWKTGEKNFIDECYSHIPFAISAEFTPATDFDWSQYPQWELYRDYFNCEDFR